MTLKAAVLLNIPDIIASEGHGASLSLQQIATHISPPPQSMEYLLRILRFLASYDVFTERVHIVRGEEKQGIDCHFRIAGAERKPTILGTFSAPGSGWGHGSILPDSAIREDIVIWNAHVTKFKCESVVVDRFIERSLLNPGRPSSYNSAMDEMYITMSSWCCIESAGATTSVIFHALRRRRNMRSNLLQRKRSSMAFTGDNVRINTAALSAMGLAKQSIIS
eukprot:Gb_41579 [translate_table: standard]